MAFNYNFTLGLAVDGRTILASPSFSGDGSDIRDLSIADGLTDQEVVMTVDVSQLKALMITSDQAVTLETNNATSPIDTFALKANEPLIWWTGSLFTNPLTADVTKFFVTNASGKTANVKIVSLQDSTL